jgi:hypothetical protein
MLQEILEVTEADRISDPSLVGIEVKTIRKEALTHQGVLEEKIETNKGDFQARLEAVDRAEKGARRRMH